MLRGSKWDSLGTSNGVVLCSYGCICVPPYYHLHERDKCDNLCYSAVCCRKYKIALEGWRKAPAVVNTCEDNTDHFIVSACAIRRKLFFFFFASLLEASPFHPRAITSTHILNQTGWWAGKGGRKWSQQFLNSIRETKKLPERQECVLGLRGWLWGLSGQQETCSHEVKVKEIWRFRKWQQERVLGIWSVTVMNWVCLWWSDPFRCIQFKRNKKAGKRIVNF